MLKIVYMKITEGYFAGASIASAWQPVLKGRGQKEKKRRTALGLYLGFHKLYIYFPVKKMLLG